jgi:hypothetical protein
MALHICASDGQTASQRPHGRAGGESKKRAVSLAAAAALSVVSVAGAQQVQITPSEAYRPADPAKFHNVPGYSPYARRRYPTRPLFGDQHVHTAWSADAGMSGTTLGPEQAPG